MTDEEMLKLRERLERERTKIAEIVVQLGGKRPKLGKILSQLDEFLAQIAAEIEWRKLDRRTAGILHAVLAASDRELVETAEILRELAQLGDTDVAYGS